MESVDIDMVIDIPDTPDRISAKRRQAAGKEHVSSSSSCSRNFCLFDEDHSNKMGDSEKIRRSRSLLGRTNSTGELENANDLQPSGKAPLLRRTAGEKDKGKAVYTKFPLKLSDDQRSLKVAGKVDKGKGKLNDETEEEKIILSSPSPPKKDDRILSFDRPVLRAPQRRRLVKNGCISPHGIAARAKKPAEDIQTSSKDDVPDQHCTREAAFTNPSPVDIQEIVKEDDASDGAKGKRAITRRFTKDSEIQIINVDETRDGRRESGSGGRRSTHSCETRIDQTFPGRNKLCSRFSAPTTSSLSARTNQKSERNQIDNRAIKRRRGNLSAASDEPGTSLYGTSEESSRSRLSNFQNHQNVAVLHQVLEPDTSPEMCVGGIGGTGSVDNGELEAKARQLEADEMLARELQEQLEQDASILDDCEIDESIAWALQREENSRHASSSQNHRPRRRSSSVSSIRQARTQLQQNSLSRRANTPRANFPVRTAWSRRNSSDRSVAGAPRNLNFRFPTGMAIESRVDMLEVLEAAAEELNGTMNRSSRLLQFDGEFSEEHYEMLLALDEDNHQHGGSSINLVNSLPQSTVKTDSFEEACVICLDTPAKGDVIRHLPCLHKFHKDCIDPWLGRSKSCPVCKSSIS